MKHRTYLYMSRRIEQSYINQSSICALPVAVGIVYGLFAWHLFILTVSSIAFIVMCISISNAQRKVRSINKQLRELGEDV